MFKKSAVKDEPTKPYNNESIPEEDKKRISTNDIIVEMNLYQFFLIKLVHSTNKDAKTADELSVELDVTKSQLNVWLKKALQEKKVKKLSKPVRYQSLVNLNQMGMFD